jgi:signal transduction histidine kinase
MTVLSRRRIRPAFAYAGIVALVGGCLGLLQQLVPNAPVTLPLRSAAFAVFGAAAMLAAWAAYTRTRMVSAQARGELLATIVAKDIQRRRVVSDVMARLLAGGGAVGTTTVSRDIAETIASALGCEHCVVLAVNPDGRTFRIDAASGWEAGAFEGVTIDGGLDTQAGYALHARGEPVIVRDADVEPRFTIPPPLRARGVRSGIAARIATGVRPYGVLAAYSMSTRSFDEHDAAFLIANATALAGAFDRKRLEAERQELATRDGEHRAAADIAARRAAFLAQTAAVLDTALEPESTLVSLARLAVPALADCAIVDLVHDDGSIRRIDVVDIDPTRREAVHAIRRVVPNLRRQGPFARAIRTGQPVLISDAGQDDGGSVSDNEQQALAQWLHCQSLLLIPLVARGQTLGLVTLGGRTASRYEAADLSLARELAARAAAALDNARLYREAQAASRAKDEFLATVSHELRTPINAVLGWAAMLRNQKLDPARVEYACEAIERSARMQADLLEQLLDVSRIVSGKFELRLAPVQVESVIDAAIDTVRPAADDKKIRIGSRIERGIPLLMADPERLQQVVTNLLSNAVKFSPDEGVVQVELVRADDAAQIVVRDQGAGIESEFLPYVFDRLRQADGPATGGNRGLGLGLWIVRDIVERHGGTVAVASAGEGKGSTFTVTLPLRSMAEPARMAAARR